MYYPSVLNNTILLTYLFFLYFLYKCLLNGASCDLFTSNSSVGTLHHLGLNTVFKIKILVNPH